jgi:hypothetical protein
MPSSCRHGMSRYGLTVVSTYIDEDSLHQHTPLIHHDGIHHINLLLEDSGSFSMRYKSGILVSVTLILEAFEYVALNILLIVSGHPWGMVFYWEVSLMIQRTIPDHTYHFPYFILFVPSSFGIFWVY